MFPFGYGLTYTSFKYSGLKVEKKVLGKGEMTNITFNLQNTGNYDSDEVAQLYVSFPDSRVERPAKALKGFKRVNVSKGETLKVTIPVKAFHNPIHFPVTFNTEFLSNIPLKIKIWLLFCIKQKQQIIQKTHVSL